MKFKMVVLVFLFLCIKINLVFAQNINKVRQSQIPEIVLGNDDNTFSNPKGQLLPFKTNKLISGITLNGSIIHFEHLNDSSKWLKDENWKIEIAQPQENSLAKRSNNLIFNSTNLYSDHAFTAVYSPSILVPQRSTLREQYKFVIKTWFELEYYYDFGKILISDDEGQNWNMLGYVTGKSNNWMELEYDISDYCGKNINIAFLLTSDDSITFQGWEIAEMKIESILTDSWKTDTGGDLDLWVGWNNTPNPAWWQYNVSSYDPPLDFNILIDEDISVYPTFVLILSAWDVDATGIGDECPGGFPEVDNVYFNGHYVGKLTGATESFSITTFEIKKEWVIGGNPSNPGVNKVEVYVDVLNRPDNCQEWAVIIDWGELTTKNLINNGVGFSTTYTDKGTDTNGNGKYEYLDVTATVVVDAGNSGTFNMNGVLKTVNGLELAWATNELYLNSGSTNILLRFDGKEINSFCINGPYYLKNTTVYQVTNPNINGWIVDAHTTNSYGFADFEASSYQKPRVVQKLPEEGSIVPVDTEIKAVFNIDMQSSTINTNSMIVKKDTEQVYGIVRYERSTKTASFVPGSTLESGQHYQVILNTDIKAHNGQNLPYVETWGFTVVTGFTFIHMTDVHIGWSRMEYEEISSGHAQSTPSAVLLRSVEAQTLFLDAFKDFDMKGINPNFIVLTGDLVESTKNHNLEQFKELVMQQTIPIYYVPGNHDRYKLSVTEMILYWGFQIIGDMRDEVDDYLQNFYSVIRNPEDYMSGVKILRGFENFKTFSNGTSSGLDWYNYTFEKDGYLFVGLDSGADHVIERSPKSEGLNIKHIDMLKSIALNNDMPKIIFMHHPIKLKAGGEAAVESESIVNYWNEFFNYCKADPNRVILILGGHTHESHVYDILGSDLDQMSHESYPAEIGHPLFVQTPSATKVEKEFEHGYRVIDVEENKAKVHKYTPTPNYHKIVQVAIGPVHIQAYDAEGTISGYGSSIVRNVPDSYYTGYYADTTSQAVILYDLSRNYLYQVKGVNAGYYQEIITSIKGGDTTTFFADAIPINQGAIHHFNVDWPALARGENGVTVNIDTDGDGTVERTIHVGRTMTAAQLTPSTGGALRNENIYIYPNPFNPDVEKGTIRYSLEKSANITIKIYDTSMQLVAVLLNDESQQANIEQAVPWDGTNSNGEIVANGVYFYIIESSAGERAVGKAAVLR